MIQAPRRYQLQLLLYCCHRVSHSGKILHMRINPERQAVASREQSEIVR
jgi:hypothetical protein